MEIWKHLFTVKCKHTFHFIQNKNVHFEAWGGKVKEIKGWDLPGFQRCQCFLPSSWCGGCYMYIHDYYLKSDPPAHYVTLAQGQKAQAFCKGKRLLIRYLCAYNTVGRRWVSFHTWCELLHPVSSPASPGHQLLWKQMSPMSCVCGFTGQGVERSCLSHQATKPFSL